MKPDQRRLTRLKRLERIRDVARLEALEKASRAEQQFARQAELARRSEQLSSAFAQRWEAESGADLRDLRAFHAGLQGLSDTMSRESLQAQQAADIHRLGAVTAERRRDLVTDQRRDAERGLQKSKTANQLAGQALLARSLNRG